MRVLYVASGIPVPGNYGGSTHTLEVAKGLADRGYEVEVIAHRGRGDAAAQEINRVRVCRLPAPKALSWAGYNGVRRLARAFQPDIVMERYYNFAGAGMLYAHRHGLPSVLEVNALMIDPRGSTKERLDRFVCLGSLSRWAVQQCRWATRIVTPLATTVPASIAAAKVFEISWGANVDLFDPGVRGTRSEELEALRSSLGIRRGSPVVVFSGSFRKWHGVMEFVEAASILHGERPDAIFLMVGAGPLHGEVARAVRRAGLGAAFRLTGPVDYGEMPLYLSLGDVGVAPFRMAAHRPLQEAGFYWSPLKVFEYMACGLPVVTIDVKPLNEIVRSGSEGLVFPEGDNARMAAAIKALIDDPESARHLGRRARRRVVERYSWQRHCELLDGLIREVLEPR